MSDLDDEPEPVATSAMVLGSSGRRDRVRSVILSMTGLVPGVGGPTRAVLEQFWGPAFNRRVTLWLEVLIDNLIDMQLSIEDLENRLRSELIASVGVVGVNAAAASPDDEKVERIAQAVSNIIAHHDEWTGSVDHALTLMHLLDETTSTQFALLQFLDGPAKWIEQHKGVSVTIKRRETDGRFALADVVAIALPRLAEQESVLATAIRGLENRGLLYFEIGEAYEASFPADQDFNKSFLTEVGREVLALVE